jgi:ABC-type transport system substrate-binding protein
MSANMLFLNNSSPVLSDVNVRKALTSGTDIGSIMQAVGYKGVPVREPILMGQIGYNPIYAQSPYDVSQAKNLLDKAGWTVVPGKAYRQKNGQDLTLNITYQRDDELARIIDVVQSEWTSLGVHVNVTIGQDTSSAPKFLDTHQYDVLLYGINMGADPDGFAYWDSSQIGKKTPIHLNLSEYSSKVADLAIEGARINTDIDLRSAKYQPFLQAWQNDAPAIGLYQPRYLYISNQPIYGYDARRPLNTPADRFVNVNEWMVNTVRTKDL